MEAGAAARPDIGLSETLLSNHAPSLVHLALAGLFALLAAKLAPHIHRSWRQRHIPLYDESRHWVLGHFFAILKPNHHLMLRAGAAKMGGIYRVHVLWKQIIVCVDARYVAKIFGAEESLNKGMEPDNADRLTSVSGHRSLFSSDTTSQHWRLIRKGTAGAFQFKNIRNGFPGVLKMVTQVVYNIKKLGPEAAFDLNNVTMRYAMDVTGLVGFAKNFETCQSFDDADTDELFDILRESMLEVYKGAINPLRQFLVFLPAVRKSPRLFKAFRQRMRELLEEVKARGPPTEDDQSIAAHLLRLRDPTTDQPLSDDVLTGEFGVYFTAGIESAGNAMSWTIFLISQRPEVEKRICDELEALGLLATPERPQPRAMELSDLQKLPYLLNTCKEAMRFKPVASTGSTRVTKRDTEVGGYTIPAGSLVLCPFDAVHHSSFNWDDPDEFKPERWEVPGTEYLPQRGGDGKHHKAVKRYLPFSTGPRQCIGQSLAHMMHDVGIAVLLSHFHFKLAPKMGGVEGVLATEVIRLTLQPGEGLWINAIPRA